MKLLGSAKSKITKGENGKNTPHLEIIKVVLVYCIIAKSDYQSNSRFLHAFFPKKSFVQLLDISPKKCLFLKTFNSEFSSIEVWFTDQNSKLLEIEDKISINLIIN